MWTYVETPRQETLHRSVSTGGIKGGVLGIFLTLLLSGMGGGDPSSRAFGEEDGPWAGQIVFPASTHLFLLSPATPAGRPAALSLPGEQGLPPMPLRQASIAGGRVTFTLTWLETEYRFEGVVDGTRMTGRVEALVPNRLLGVSLGNRVVVRGTWAADRLDGDAPGALAERLQARSTPAGGIQFIEWLDRIDPGTGRVGIRHTYLADGRYILRDAATEAPQEGYDGARYWRMRPDGLSEFVAPPESDRLRLLAWLRAGMPGDDTVEMQVEGIDAASGDILVLARPVGGRVGARLWLDSAGFHLRRAVVEDEQEVIELRFGKIRETGRPFPETWSIHHNGRETASRLSEPAEANGGVFDNPGIGPRATFLADGPAYVDVETGKGQKGHHFVHPQIDGYTAGWFLVDSGASDLVIDREIADRIGLPILREISPGVTLRQGQILRLGRLTLVNPIFIARDLSGLTGPEGRERAGILGFPLFQSAVVVIEYPTDRMALYDPASYRLPAGGAWAPMSVEARPSIEARVDADTPGRFVVDTGKSARISFRSTFAARHRLLDNRSLDLTPTETFYGGTFEYRSRLDAVQFAGYRFRNSPFHVKIPGTFNSAGSYDGIIGRGFLDNFTVVFDYRNERIAFIR